jgi:hypothetical protein
MVANLWGIELQAPNVRTALPQLVNAMLNAELANEVLGSLPSAAQDAVIELASQNGLLPRAQFLRTYGEVREMGAARRDRERPDLNPRTPAEQLWYYGLIGQAFLDIPPEPQEYVYIPGDLLSLLEIPEQRPADSFGRPASPGESAHLMPASDRILDHACTLLAALRLGMAVETIPVAQWEIPLPQLTAILFSAGLLDANGLPLPDPVRNFLEAPREQALLLLAAAWLHSTSYNELRLLPGLVFEGDWANDPLQTRSRLLEHLSRLPQDSWWSLAAFTAGVREHDPDFQRPAGDYDSWFIRRADSDQYLRGFSTWDEVDGEVVRSMVRGPLHWLGILDLAAPDGNSPAAAFRLSAWGTDLLLEHAPPAFPVEDGLLTVYAAGRVDVPHLLPRAARYQLARFTRWVEDRADGYRYQIVPESLERARQQRLRVSQLIALLKKHNKGPLPPTLVNALERWEQNGTEAHLDEVQLLRVSRPEILTTLRKTRVSRFLGEELSPTAVLVRTGGSDAVLQALAELGYLGEARLGTDV